jgi:hypothetical protein
MAKSPKRLPSDPNLDSTLAPGSPLDSDQTTTLTLRLRRSTAEAIAGSAKEQGLTMKQVICKALTEAGLSVAAVDLEDRTPRRQL